MISNIIFGTYGINYLLFVTFNHLCACLEHLVKADICCTYAKFLFVRTLYDILHGYMSFSICISSSITFDKKFKKNFLLTTKVNPSCIISDL